MRMVRVQRVKELLETSQELQENSAKNSKLVLTSQLLVSLEGKRGNMNVKVNMGK